MTEILVLMIPVIRLPEIVSLPITPNPVMTEIPVPSMISAQEGLVPAVPLKTAMIWMLALLITATS
jgi:hypothetical protein